MKNQITNENILKLSFSNLALLELNLIFDKMDNKILCIVLQRLLKNINDIYRSIGKFKTIRNKHKNCIQMLDMLPNNKMISSSSASIIIWDLNNRSFWNLSPPQPYLGRIAVLPDGLIFSASIDGLIKYWDYKNNYKGYEFKIEDGFRNFEVLGLLPNCHLAFSAYYEEMHCIAILDYKNNFECITILKAHKTINAFVNLSNNKFASGSGDGTIKIWDSNDNYNCLSTLENESWLLALIFINKKSELIAGTYNKIIKVWNIISYQCVNSIYAHSGGVCSFLLLPRGYLVSGSYDGKIKIWKLESFECVKSLDTRDQVLSLTLLNDGRIGSACVKNILIVY
jgi:WD40 repeat protein